MCSDQASGTSYKSSYSRPLIATPTQEEGVTSENYYGQSSAPPPRSSTPDLPSTPRSGSNQDI